MRLIIAFLIIAGMVSAQDISFRRQRPAAGGGGATYRDSAQINNDASGGALTTTETLDIQAGDLIVALVGGDTVEDPSTTINTVSCGGQALSRVKIVPLSGSGYYVEMWYLQNASAYSGATCTFTPQRNGAYRFIAAVNYGGIATTGALKESSCNSAGCDALATASTGRTAQNITTSEANSLLVAGVIDWHGGTTHTGANGYTVRVDANTAMLADKAVSSTGSYPDGSFSTASSQEYLSIFAAFKIQ
jgi:hypothetical protein